MITSDSDNGASSATRLAETALRLVNEKSPGTPLPGKCPVTLNFHPDVMVQGEDLLSTLVHDGIYRSQFETATSNGGLSAHVGGNRWLWEQKMFGGIYDNEPPSLRPKYGALNYRNTATGGAPRFGSAHLRLKPSVTERCTFAYPDSHLDPTDFGTAKRMALIPMADANVLNLDILDNYVEAHVHGLIDIHEDVEAIVLDPSYRNSSVESAARKLPCKLEWHRGFSLSVDRLSDCATYRGNVVADFIQQVAVQGRLTAALLGRHRVNSVDAQVLKKAWHCVARFGGPLESVD